MTSKAITSKSYDGLHELKFETKRHFYWLDDVIVPGVTTINKKGGPMPEMLLNWYIDNGRKSKKKSADAVDIGKIVHKYAELCTEGKALNEHLNKIKQHKDRIKIENCLRLFDAWHNKNVDTVEGAEILVASPKLKFAGTIDRLVYSRKWGKVIDDYKTSKWFFLDNFIQASGYALAAQEWLNTYVDTYRILLFSKTEAEFHTLIVTGDAWLLDDKNLPDFGINQIGLKRQFLRNLASMKFHKAGDKMFNQTYKESKNG